jgi:DNA-binding NtrC family response regulator
MLQMQDYAWPGNVRELRNVIERAVILCRAPILSIPLPSSLSARAGPPSTRLKDVEIAHIRNVLDSTHWRIRGKEGAAERLGLKPSTLETRMSKLGLTRPKST